MAGQEGLGAIRIRATDTGEAIPSMPYQHMTVNQRSSVEAPPDGLLQ